LKPIIICANCSVEYQGRASSTLKTGNYLIIIKKDQSIQIQGINKVRPLNYQPEKSKFKIENNKIISHRKTESIVIDILKIHWTHDLSLLSNNEPEVTKTEQEIVEKLILNLPSFINDKIISIHREYKVENGAIDIYVKGEKLNHIIEAKRHRVNINTCIQVKKYMECIPNSKGYVSAPTINQKAINYCETNNITYIKIDHSSQ